MTDKIQQLKERLAALEYERMQILHELELLEKQYRAEQTKVASSKFSPAEKIAIFQRLFRGREDVYPRRFESKKSGKSGYQPVCNNEWRPGICNKPKIKCSKCEFRSWQPLNTAVIEKHLRGDDGRGNDFTIGVYPMLQNEHCCFLAVDFDKKDFRNDVTAFLATCKKFNIPAALERSRSGNGAHVWIFFKEPIPAATARQMGSFLLTETMENHPELGFDSYDRFFPNQDTMPSGGLGNLIALPLQAKPRANGNSVFLDENFQPYIDQWDFLAKLQQMPKDAVYEIAQKASASGRITAVQMPNTEDDEVPWQQPPSRKKRDENLNKELQGALDIVIENQIYFSKEQLTPKLRTTLLRLAAFQNPQFYSTQAMRMPVFNIPRIICCAEDFPKHIGLPRGCADNIAKLLIENNILYNVSDKRNRGQRQDFRFNGILREEQQKAVEALMKYDLGVLSASTAFGKTVVAINLLVKRNVNTLILVHRVQLLDQWKNRLQTFLGLDASEIGIWASGKKKINGKLDIASIQSLVRHGVVDDMVGKYGMVIVDECHHLSAFSFESVIRQCKCQYVLGLSATLTRKDGHHPIIFMQCGPIRYRVNDKQQALERPFDHSVIVRNTEIALPAELAGKEKLAIHEIYDLLIHNEKRNRMIVKDIREAVAAGRNPVVITERKDHLAWFENEFSDIKNLFVLRGGMRKKALNETLQKISSSPDENRLILATGKFLGEGFDDPRLDTLFLTMPISWRGTLSQYAGRLHRLYDRKTEVLVYDYVDCNIPVTLKMFERRKKGYKAIGYNILQEDN